VSIRLRLTGLYALLFLAAGAVLLAITYGLVDSAVTRRVGIFIARGPASSFEPSVFQRALAAYVQTQKLEDALLQELLVQSSIALGLTAVLTVGLGWVMAGRALRPVHRITATARRLSRENLHERIGLRGPQDELKDLADTFDAMLERLQTAFDSQHRFVANASHELRTPLAVQRTLIDVVLRDPSATRADLRATLAQLRDVVDRNDRLIDGLLLLARSERGLERTAPVDLEAETDQVVEQVGAEAAGKRVVIEPRTARAVATGDRALLRRLVENLVENAVRHNVEGGWVEVSLAEENGCALLRVANGGPAIASHEVPGLFEPFRRLGVERIGDGGMGLGLSIVQAIARAHGGSVGASAPASGGLVVTVRLPIGGANGSAHWSARAVPGLREAHVGPHERIGSGATTARRGRGGAPPPPPGAPTASA
jgi:signal transduction histidine kinase